MKHLFRKEPIAALMHENDPANRREWRHADGKCENNISEERSSTTCRSLRIRRVLNLIAVTEGTTQTGLPSVCRLKCFKMQNFHLRANLDLSDNLLASKCCFGNFMLDSFQMRGPLEFISSDFSLFYVCVHKFSFQLKFEETFHLPGP